MNDTQYQAINGKLDRIYSALWERLGRQDAMIAVLAQRVDQITNNVHDIKAMQAIILRNTYTGEE